MADQKQEPPSTSSFRTTLRRLATEADPAERQRIADLFASQVEVALDQQGSVMQFSLWNTEERFGEKINDIHKSISDTNTLSSAVLEAVTGLRADVQASAAETAARLGKIETDLGEMAGTMLATIGRVSNVEETVDGHNTLLTDHEARIAATQAWIKQAEPRLQQVEAETAALRREVNRVTAHLQHDKDYLRRLAEESGGES